MLGLDFLASCVCGTWVARLSIIQAANMCVSLSEDDVGLSAAVHMRPGYHVALVLL